MCPKELASLQSRQLSILMPGRDSSSAPGLRFQLPISPGSERSGFGIKADFESGFNFQCSSGAGKTSVFPFTTVGSAGKWKLISAPVAEFRKPPWAKANAADLKAIHFFQVTAFGSPPYDGKTILLDQLEAGSVNAQHGHSCPSRNGEGRARVAFRRKGGNPSKSERHAYANPKS